MDPESRRIPILRVPFSDADRRIFHQEIDDVLDSGILSMGDRTRSFEKAFGDFVGAPYCVATSNGTSAIEVIVRALGIRDRSIIIPTNTFFATALAVLNSGNRVVFADSDPATLCLDPEDVRRRVRDDTAAVIHVHIGGIVSPAVREIGELCHESGMHLIEDCAHAHGSTIEGLHAGTLGVAGAFSFFPTKVLTTGEGGAITTADRDLYERSLIIRNQGKDPAVNNRINEVGSNHRMSELTAALGLEQMAKAGRVIEERQALARSYDRALEAIEGIEPLPLPERTGSGFYKYVAYLADGIDRAKLKERMSTEYGVSLTGEVYADLCHEEPVWQRYGYCGRPRREPGGPCPGEPECRCGVVQESFPGADHLSQRHICLPLYPGLIEADIDWVATALERAIKEEG